MIEFSGYLTGSALKHYFNWLIRICMIFFSACACVSLPMFVLLFKNYIEIWKIIVVLIVIFAPGMFLASYAQVKYDKRQMKLDKNTNIPKLIYIKDGIIVIKYNQSMIKRKIVSVKEVRDYGEYYALFTNNFSKYSQFICQKSLLTKGSINEFETLFEDKIVRKTKQ